MNESTALLVIDMQVCGFDGQIMAPIDNGAVLLRDVAELIDAARRASVPVIHVQHCGQEGQPYSRGTHGWDIHPLVSPRSGEAVVRKKQSSAFIETELADVLAENEITTLITCGIQSEYCVSKTSMSALELGYQVYVAGDGHGTVSTDEEDASAIIARQNVLLAERDAQIRTVNSLLALIAPN